MISGVTVVRKFHIQRQAHGRQKLAANAPPDALPGRVPRVARLMALAIHMEQLLEKGTVADQAELARLGHVSRARISQIMNLRLLAPDIQEALLLLPRIERGPQPVVLRQLQPIALEPSWKKQRLVWQRLIGD